MNNIILRTGIVIGITYYIYDKYSKKPSPLSDYKDIPVIDPDFKPILNPEPGQIEDILKQQQTSITTTTTTENYAGGGWADAYTGGGAGGTTTTTTTTIPADNYTNAFNPDNPYDASGFNPAIYAGGYADSYSAYS